jgi:hypothetical protein
MEMQNNMNKFPTEKLEILFIWGDRILAHDEHLQTKEVLFEYLSELLLELLNNYITKYESKLSSLTSSQDLKSNYYIQNYLIFVTKLYQFSYLFKLDAAIKTNGIAFMISFFPNIDLPSLYLSSMRIGFNAEKKIEEYWLDYKYFNEIYRRVKNLWKMEKLYKGHDIKKIKKENK